MKNVSLLKCPVCAGDQIIVIGKPQISSQASKLVNEDYRVVKCKTCRFYFVFPKICFSQQEWEKLYGEEYFGETPRWWARKRREHRKQRMDWLQECSRDRINKFLDIGCGEGYVLMDAIKRGWNTYGIDISDNRIDAARNKSITFTKGDIFEASFPDDFFDCIYIDSVLEHILDPIGYLCEVRRILKIGGVLYVGVPNEDCLFNDVKRLLFVLSGNCDLSARIQPFKPPYHVVGFTKRSLMEVFRENGFEVLKFRNFAGQDEWMKFKPFTKPFVIHFFLLPVHLMAIPLRKRVYLDAIVRKSDR